jgi:hypothetical protein
MSESPEVDFSQIRGDWYFHMNFLSNAVERTLLRAGKLLGEVRDDVGPEIAQLVTSASETWSQLSSDRGDKGAVNIQNPLLDEFIAQIDKTKEACDTMETAKGCSGSSSIYDTPLEHFTEAVRQARGFAPDLVMMREQRPG